MKISALFIGLLFLLGFNTKAQKVDISYGIIMGLNTSAMYSKTTVDNNYPFHEKDMNFNISSSNQNDFGYNLGIFFNIKPIKSRFNFELGLYTAKYNNSHAISLDYNAYTLFSSSIDNWVKANETENLTNEFSVINIPLMLGYNFFQKDKYSFNFLCGISANINLNSNDYATMNMDMEESYLYKEYYLGYHTVFRSYFDKIFCQFKYERTLNIQAGSSRDYFAYEMNVEKLYLNVFNISVGYIF